MARARQLKPGFFKNEDLARCTPWARLMYAGLWTLGDREGRLEDRPLHIKGELFPFDDVSAEVLLSELAAAVDHVGQPAFILRYEVNGGKYIQIIHFTKHQNPHVKEGASTIPAPCKPGAGTGRARGKHRASPGNSGTSRASSLLPLPSSLFPLTSSKERGRAPTTPEFPPDDDPPTPPGTFTRPTVEEVRAHIKEHGYTFTAEAFMAHYNSNGWKVGKVPMKDWCSACVTWQGREPPRPAVTPKPPTLCRDCHEPMTRPETMEGTTCRACREDHGV